MSINKSRRAHPTPSEDIMSYTPPNPQSFTSRITQSATGLARSVISNGAAASTSALAGSAASMEKGAQASSSATATAGASTWAQGISSGSARGKRDDNGFGEEPGDGRIDENNFRDMTRARCEYEGVREQMAPFQNGSLDMATRPAGWESSWPLEDSQMQLLLLERQNKDMTEAARYDDDLARRPFETGRDMELHQRHAMRSHNARSLGGEDHAIHEHDGTKDGIGRDMENDYLTTYSHNASTAQQEDGAEVLALLDHPNSSFSDPAALQTQLDDAADVSADELFGAQPPTNEERKAESAIRSSLPDPPKHHPISTTNSTKVFLPDLGMLDLTSGISAQAVLQQWDDVLNAYTDEVWGDALPLVKEARQEIEQLKKGGDQVMGQEVGWKTEVRALERLKMVLRHVDLPEGAARPRDEF